MDTTLKYTCINCGSKVKELYKVYSSSVLKLSTCNICNKIVDKYIEYDPVIIIIDLVLLSREAYRHCLFNANNKFHWKLLFMLALLEAYLRLSWVAKLRNPQMVHNSTDLGIHKPLMLDKFYTGDIDFYRTLFCVAYSNIFFIWILFAFSYVRSYAILKRFTSIRELLKQIVKCVALSSFGEFLFLPSLIWEKTGPEEYHLICVVIYTALSQLVAYTVLSKCSKSWSIVVISLTVNFVFENNKLMSNMESEFPYKSGHWYWSSSTEQLEFKSHEVVSRIAEEAPKLRKRWKQFTVSPIHFRSHLEPVDRLQFRRVFQRRIATSVSTFITLQDVKDVALFLSYSDDLSVEFINYLHLPEADRFLKALIIYFHYYLQLIAAMNARRKKIKRKLREPIVNIQENYIRDNLTDLRLMVAREYSTIIMGVGDMKEFHHLATSSNSSTERDRRLIEALLCISARIVWIALQRKYFQHIEAEMNRLFRNEKFLMPYRSNQKFRKVEHDLDILLRRAKVKDKLKVGSCLINELLHGAHDYRLLGTGFHNFQPKSRRTIYMEKIFAAPYENLFENGITIGLIGIPREDYDSLLFPRERTSENYQTIIHEPKKFKFPRKTPISYESVPLQFPQEPCQYKETLAEAKARATQNVLWVSHLLGQDEPVRLSTSIGTITSSTTEV